MKVKDFICENWNKLYDGFKRFAITYILLIVFAVAFDIHERAGWSELYFEGGLGYGITASLFASLLFERIKSKRIFSVIVPAVMGVVASVAMWQVLEHHQTGFVFAFYNGTLIAMVTLSLWLLCKKNNVNTIYMELLWAVGYAALATFILFLGLMVCFWAFDSLIFSIDNDFWQTIPIYCWFAFFPIGFLSRIPSEDNQFERPKIYVRFFTFLVIPCLILLAILLVYVSKIIFTGKMPSGTLNVFSSICILVYLFMYAAIKGNSSKILTWILRWCWVPIIPIVIAQIVGIIIRYNAYGLTTPRMMGMVTLAVGIYGLYLTARNKSLKSMWIVIPSAAIVFSISPINVIDIPVKNQNDRIERILVKHSILQEGKLVIPEKLELSDEENKTILEGWHYLSDSEYFDTDKSKVLVNYFSIKKPIEDYAKENNYPYADLCGFLGVNDLECNNVFISLSSKYSFYYYIYDESLPVPTFGYSYFMPYNLVGRERAEVEEKFVYKDGKYLLTMPSGVEEAAELVEYDVTKHINAMLTRAYNGANESGKSYAYRIDMIESENEPIWRLDDNIIIVVSSAEVYDPTTISIKPGEEKALDIQFYALFK